MSGTILCRDCKKTPHWYNDARGIPAFKACEDCKEEQMQKFRSEIFTDPNYQSDEQIEADE